MAAESALLFLNTKLGACVEAADGLNAAIQLIAVVSTIVESVAGHGTINAVTAATAELVRKTQALSLTNSWIFIGTVFAVLVVVANFGLGDAKEVVAAEFAGRTN